jgi:hypothetical protein
MSLTQCVFRARSGETIAEANVFLFASDVLMAPALMPIAFGAMPPQPDLRRPWLHLFPRAGHAPYLWRAIPR